MCYIAYRYIIKRVINSEAPLEEPKKKPIRKKHSAMKFTIMGIILGTISIVVNCITPDSKVILPFHIIDYDLIKPQVIVANPSYKGELKVDVYTHALVSKSRLPMTLELPINYYSLDDGPRRDRIWIENYTQLNNNLTGEILKWLFIIPAFLLTLKALRTYIIN